MATHCANENLFVVYCCHMCCAVSFELNQPKLQLDCEEDLRESQPLLSMSYVPEITTAKSKPLIHAEAVALFNDTWQILHEGESQPASWVNIFCGTFPGWLPLLVSVSPDKSGCVYLRRRSNSAASIYWSQVDYRINTIQMDGSNSKLHNSQVWDLYWQQGLQAIQIHVICLFSVSCSLLRPDAFPFRVTFCVNTAGQEWHVKPLSH